MSQTTSKSNTILPLYIPLVLAYMASFSPATSYLIAWLGSFFIFYWTWFSPSTYFKTDLPVRFQLMRPIFLVQVIFAGFMCSTSIFYFLDHLGYQYFTRNLDTVFHENEQTMAIAQCQRLALMAHSALVTGLILSSKRTDVRQKRFKLTSTTDFLVGFSIGFYLLGLLFQQFSGLYQIGIILSASAISTGALLLVKGIVEKNIRFLIVGAAIFITNFLNATLTGFKEPIIVNIVILICLLYPYYKKLVLISALPLIYILFYILPTYATVVRKSWSGDTTAESARSEALNLLQDADNDEQIDETNWQFLTNRLSEIGMFTQFIEYVPEKHKYYGWEIFNQSITAIIPRAFWPAKPNIEVISMERVYEADVINRMSNVSAKTRPIVDAYVSWGTTGVFIFMLIYGLMVQWLCNKCEQLFGGYELGCIVMFNSLFQTLWRGNNFEFMFNNIFYGFLMMYLIFWVLKSMKIIHPQFAKMPELPHRPNPFTKRPVKSDF